MCTRRRSRAPSVRDWESVAITFPLYLAEWITLHHPHSPLL